MKKAAVYTLGCKVNQYETGNMIGQLESAGYEIVDFADFADVYIVNTCTVTAMADSKSRQALHKARRKNPQALVIAAGCYPQTSEKELAQDTLIDVVIGNAEKDNIIPIIESVIAGKGHLTKVSDIAAESIFKDACGGSRTENIRAFIKIEDGCNNFCSYCIIPYARGRVRSRRTADIVSEYNALVQKGYKEVVITGIEVASFGADTGESLTDLIAEIDDISQGSVRIRLGSLEPRLITQDFADKLRGVSGLCPHFHLSLQSGCDATLKRMNRKYTTADYIKAVDILRKTFDRPAITTDVIVGFPGETEDEFLSTLDFVRSIGFSRVHIFPYSKRKGTAAAGYNGQVSKAEKARRCGLLSEVCEKSAAQYAKTLVGTQQEVLFEQPCGNDMFEGYTKTYIKAKAQLPPGSEGKIIKVQAVKSHGGELFCRV